MGILKRRQTVRILQHAMDYCGKMAYLMAQEAATTQKTAPLEVETANTYDALCAFIAQEADTFLNPGCAFETCKAYGDATYWLEYAGYLVANDFNLAQSLLLQIKEKTKENNTLSSLLSAVVHNSAISN